MEHITFFAIFLYASYIHVIHTMLCILKYYKKNFSVVATERRVCQTKLHKLKDDIPDFVSLQWIERIPFEFD